jgi:hypothetical protein
MQPSLVVGWVSEQRPSGSILQPFSVLSSESVIQPPFGSILHPSFAGLPKNKRHTQMVADSHET